MDTYHTMPSRGQRPDPDEACHAGTNEDAQEDYPPCYYPSNAADTYIVNAMTGEPYPFKVGSARALRLFRVTDATGTYDERGYELRPGAARKDDTVGKTPNNLYYTSPQEYLTHFPDACVRKEVLSAWAARVNRLFPAEPCREGAEPKRPFSAQEWATYQGEHTRARGRPVVTGA